MARTANSKTRESLMEAAFGLVRAQGLAATSVDDICKAAGVSKGAFFHHFRSKEDLATEAAQQLLVAGNETTTHSIAEGILLLIENPDQHALLKADPGLIPNFTEEVLRLASPTANMWRVATRDTEINGMPVAKGGMVQLRFSSANRDEQVFPGPHRLDVSRENAARHVAFGHGVHMCIGASLARGEMNVAFRVLLERLDDFALDCRPDELVYAPNVLLRGLSKLPIRFRRRSH